MIVTTEAIVLRVRKQGETSKIVTLYTLAYGKLNVIAKGARETKSKFGASLEMFAKSSVVFYKKEKHDALSLLSKAETISSHSGILKSLTKIEAATEIVELLLNAMHDEEANEALFRLLDRAMESISEAPADALAESAVRSRQIKFYVDFAAVMGFAIESGEVSEEMWSLLAPFQTTELLQTAELPALVLKERDYVRLTAFFESYFAEHLPGVTRRSMKSTKVFSSL